MVSVAAPAGPYSAAQATMAIDVKICGLSTPETVAAAVDGGARFVGFVFFATSPRAVTPAQAFVNDTGLTRGAKPQRPRASCHLRNSPRVPVDENRHDNLRPTQISTRRKRFARAYRPLVMSPYRASSNGAWYTPSIVCVTLSTAFLADIYNIVVTRFSRFEDKPWRPWYPRSLSRDG